MAEQRAWKQMEFSEESVEGKESFLATAFEEIDQSMKLYMKKSRKIDQMLSKARI